MKEVIIIKTSYYNRKTITGTTSGYFNIYQAKNGKIYLTMGNVSIALTEEQVNKLGIDLYELEDFSTEDYKAAYPKHN